MQLKTQQFQLCWHWRNRRQEKQGRGLRGKLIATFKNQFSFPCGVHIRLQTKACQQLRPESPQLSKSHTGGTLRQHITLLCSFLSPVESNAGEWQNKWVLQEDSGLSFHFRPAELLQSVPNKPVTQYKIQSIWMNSTYAQFLTAWTGIFCSSEGRSIMLIAK